MRKFKLFFVSMLVAVLILPFISPAFPVHAVTLCDAGQFVADVTIPDGTSMKPGESFNKTWRIKNVGSCTWSTDYKLVFASGEAMGALTSSSLPKSVAPGETVDLTLKMTAPSTAGVFRGNWWFKNAKAATFGLGAKADKPFWVEVRVASSVNTTYDFVANAPSAIWTSGSGALAYPGTDGDAKGFVLKLDTPKLETSAVDANPGLLMVPPTTYNSYIQGQFPAFRVEKGDRFQALINCEYAAINCYVGFRIDYQVGSGPVKTFWYFIEKYDHLYYRADIDLSSLAGQDVKFILRINAAGLSGGDRAVWVNPRIVRTGSTAPTATPVTPTTIPPTATPSPTTGPGTPTSIPPTATHQAGCDKVSFVADVTIPDGKNFFPNTAFTKTWRLKNVGTCAWTQAYTLVFVSGDKMGGPDTVVMPKYVGAGETVDISVPLTAPALGGTYRGYWQFKNDAGQLFGIGANYDKPWWADIYVTIPVTPVVTQPGPTPTKTPIPPTPIPTHPPLGVAYDFAANAASAAWWSGAGQLPFPGTDGDAKGFALKSDAIALETGATDLRSGLLVAPQSVYNGYIQGIYPWFTVQKGDRFQATIGCQYGYTSCYVGYRLDYQIGTTIKTLWAFSERYEKLVYDVNLDLSALAGQNVKFRLVTTAAGYPTGDRAVWINPRIVRNGTATIPAPTALPDAATLVPTSVSTLAPTSTPISTDGWAKYTNSYGFSIKIPSPPTITGSDPKSVRVQLPFTPGTNLGEKYIEITVGENVTTCSGLNYENPDPLRQENVTYNGVTFLKQMGVGAAAGSVYDWMAFSTLRGTTCINLVFILHSSNPGNFATPPALFNYAAESAIFPVIMSTFQPGSGPYAVYGVVANDVLNARVQAGTQNTVVGTYPPDANDIYLTGNSAVVSGDKWVESARLSATGSGWVNSFYLMEYVDKAAFCADAKVSNLLAQFKQAVSASNGAALSGLVSPTHGLDVYYAAYNPPVHFTVAAAQGVFGGTTSYNWGTGPGGGPDQVGTFNDIIRPKLVDVLEHPEYAVYCETPKSGSLVWENIWNVSRSNLRYYSLYRPGTPGTDLDWRSWVAGVEYVNGQPYIVLLMQFQWEP